VAAESTAMPADLRISLRNGTPQRGFLYVKTIEEALYPLLAGCNSVLHARTFTHPEAASAQFAGHA
jgi:hypothetical protein